ncbi:hypothetical protein HD595_003703 [Nonomuraea roseoviolacea subsp. carminata]|uniref:Uncharacterized protein n=1 Tax=Nonomuraea roseoviolacea subsp. carminata TaxID=160689 RepID=A0ABT1K0Q2_9ACTN|nr:hypothetical protein [Nonomuraea roseoviolacea subsp. carminata]
MREFEDVYGRLGQLMNAERVEPRHIEVTA